MADKGRAAVYKATGQPMEIREYPVPDPEPGAILVKISVANICGSDMHMWRGDSGGYRWPLARTTVSRFLTRSLPAPCPLGRNPRAAARVGRHGPAFA